MVPSLKHFFKNTWVIQWTFGIRYVIGDKVIEIQDDTIEIDGGIYMATSGLCALIAEKYHKEYSTEDYERYKKLQSSK